MFSFPSRRGNPAPVNSLSMVFCSSWCHPDPLATSSPQLPRDLGEPIFPPKPTSQSPSLFLPLLLFQKYCLSPTLSSCGLAMGIRKSHSFSLVIQSCLTLCNPMDCSTPGFPIHHQLLELIQTHVHRVNDAIQPSYLLSSPSPAFNLSQHQVLSNESVCTRWPKYWSFSFSISPSNEYSGLISFRTDWLDSLAVQGTLKSLLQHHSSKASILWCSAFFIVQLSHHIHSFDLYRPQLAK